MLEGRGTREKANEYANSVRRANVSLVMRIIKLEAQRQHQRNRKVSPLLDTNLTATIQQ
jgi:hypothetical protein